MMNVAEKVAAAKGRLRRALADRGIVVDEADQVALLEQAALFIEATVPDIAEGDPTGSYVAEAPKEERVIYEIPGAIRTPEVKAALEKSMQKVPPKPRAKKS